jgi:hypothetical protein
MGAPASAAGQLGVRADLRQIPDSAPRANGAGNTSARAGSPMANQGRAIGASQAAPLLVLAAYALIVGFVAKRFFGWEQVR